MEKPRHINVGTSHGQIQAEVHVISGKVNIPDEVIGEMCVPTTDVIDQGRDETHEDKIRKVANALKGSLLDDQAKERLLANVNGKRVHLASVLTDRKSVRALVEHPPVFQQGTYTVYLAAIPQQK